MRIFTNISLHILTGEAKLFRYADFRFHAFKQGSYILPKQKGFHMEYYFAPLEGITGWIYRNAHARHFPGIDRYYTPFIAAHKTHKMKTREKKDVSPSNNAFYHCVPQVLTKVPEDFISTIRSLSEMGYREVNLNLGCPVPTVTTKGKGSAMLGDPEALDRFFDETFERMSSEHLIFSISVKSRIGVNDPAEAVPIFEVFNRYPLTEIIVHPRTTREMYQGIPHRDVFEDIMRMSTHPLCYNGDIKKPSDLDFLAVNPSAGSRGTKEPPFKIPAVMIGRGLLRNPALVRELQGGPALEPEELRAFFRDIQRGYEAEMSGEKPVLAKMKELWWYAGDLFADSDRELKKIKKAKTISEYEMAVSQLFSSKGGHFYV